MMMMMSFNCNHVMSLIRRRIDRRKSVKRRKRKFGKEGKERRINKASKEGRRD